MEFTIDLAAIRKLATQECATATAEIASIGVMNAYDKSRVRHDARLAAAADANTLACKAGCSWCCHFSVDARAVEVFTIQSFIDNELPAEQRTRVKKEIAINSAVLSQLSDIERVQRNIKCPFLDAGQCVIYSVRPQTCRNYHATDAKGCQQSYEEPHNLDIDPDFAPLVYQAGGTHVDAFSKAMQGAGFDATAYELNTALSAAMAEPQSRQRFLNKQPTFITLQGTEVPPEFIDLE
jgi:Fe-S-cluster containining protein